MSPPTVWSTSVILGVVGRNNAGIRNVFSLNGHGGLLLSFACGICRVRGLFLLHHAQAAARRLGAVVKGSLEFGAGREDNANSLALL